MKIVVGSKFWSASLKVCLGYGVARRISSRQCGKCSDLSMKGERLRGRIALLICSYTFSGVVDDRCDAIPDDARHRSMVSRWQVITYSVVQDAGNRVFRQWKRPVV